MPYADCAAQNTDVADVPIAPDQLLFIQTLASRVIIAAFVFKLCRLLWMWAAIATCLAIILSFPYVGFAFAVLVIVMLEGIVLSISYMRRSVRTARKFCDVHKLSYHSGTPL